MDCGVFQQCFPQQLLSPSGAETLRKRAFRFHAFDSQTRLPEETIYLKLFNPIVSFGMTFRRAPSNPPPVYWCQVDKVEVGSDAESAGVLSGAFLVEVGLKNMKYVQYNEVLARLKHVQEDEAGDLTLVFSQSYMYRDPPLPSSGPRWPVPGESIYDVRESESSSRPRTASNMTQFWMSDQHAKSCVACSELFTFCRRRHHCRSCGQIFCSNCCHRLPPSFKPRDASMLWLRNQLVCHQCHRQLKEGLLHAQPAVRSKSLPLPPPTASTKLHRLSSLHPPTQSPPEAGINLPNSIPEEHNQFLQDINPILYSIFPKARMLLTATSTNALSFHKTRPASLQKTPSRLRRSGSEPDLIRRVHFAVDEEETSNETRPRFHSRASFVRDLPPLFQDGNYQLSTACANAMDLPDIAAAHARNRQSMAEDATTFVLDRLVSAMERSNISQLSIADQCAFVDVLLSLSTETAVSVEDGVAGCRIKCFPGGAPTDSFLVPGVLLKKRTARKSMRNTVDKPRVLVIASALDYHKDKESFSPLEIVAGLETEYMRIAAEKIKRLRPDVVVFERHVHRVAEECLAMDDIVVIKNIKDEDLRRIARVTRAAILTTVDHVDKMDADTILGTCKQFRVWTPNPPETTQKKVSKKKCVVFETDDLVTGATICLRGAKTKAELSELREILLQIIHLAYHLRLQRAIWSAWGIASIKGASASSNGPSPFDSMYLKLRENSLSMRAALKLEQLKCISCKFVERKAQAVSVQRRRSSGSLEFEKPTQPCSCPPDIRTPQWPFQLVVSTCWSRLDANIPSVAEWNVLQFYNTDSDCSLGQFLTKYCFDTAAAVYKNAFRTHQLSFTHDMARVHIRVSSTQTQPTKKKGVGEVLKDMVNFARSVVQTSITPITWIAHGASSSPVYTEMTHDMLSYSFGKFLEDLIYMKPLPFDSVYPELEDAVADQLCVRYFACKDVVVAVSTERIEPVLHVALRPSLWESNQTTASLTNELFELADEVKALTMQKIDDSLAAHTLLQQTMQLKTPPKSIEELNRLRGTVRFWFVSFTEKLRAQPPQDIFAKHALFREIYDHAAHMCMELRDSSTQSTFKLSNDSDHPTSTALPAGWMLQLPDLPNESQQPSHATLLEELSSAPKTLSSVDTTATAAEYVSKIRTGEIQREKEFDVQLHGAIAFPDVVDVTSDHVFGSSSLTQSDSQQSWNRTWVAGSEISKIKSSTTSHLLELPKSILSWHPSLPKGVDEVVMLVNSSQPTSVVAYSLCSVAYHTQLTHWFSQENRNLEVVNEATRNNMLAVLRSDRRSNFEHFFADESEFQSLTKFSCKSFYATQFHALRQLVDYDERRYVESLSTCETYQSGGGKSGAGFMKTKDERFLTKVVSSNQLHVFLSLIPKYFEYLAKTIEDGTPTMLSKVVGVYRITIDDMSMCLLVMENLVYNRKVDALFDLKGKMEGRTADHGTVLWDRNFVKMFQGIPLALQESAMVHLKTAMMNDTTFLAAVDVVDYSMLVGYDKRKQEVVACIIDYIVKYDFMKRLEHHGKRLLQDEGEITVLNPKQYTKRFQTAMTKYFTPVPSRYSAIVPRHDDDSS
ncbi:hypothetical protein LEN26_007035 [Aphanomyces euteiches]|nr:hypothetical protein LEN26_007035 [Aphanomyces euteiches]